MADMAARETAELLLLVGRLLHAEGYSGDLSPAQWMALRFFARANAFSRTPSAFAEFQATTRGTASQAIKALETSGYLVRQRSRADGRIVTLHLTDKGWRAVARDPFEGVVQVMETFSADKRATLHDSLRQLLTALTTNFDQRHFGVCRDCACFADEQYGQPASVARPVSKCLRFGAQIAAEDRERLCAYFQPRNERSAG
jgi:DNA-binding MarR family transcriptional regulator